MSEISWRQMPPLSALRAFEATARTKSFSAAARALNVTHAAVSQQVRALESHLGIALVLREGRALALTAEGEELANALGDGFKVIQTAVEAVRAGGANRPLVVTLTPSFALQWLMPRMGDFWRRHPDLPVTLQPDHRVIDLRREGVDIGIRYGNGHWPGADVERLVSARYVVVAAPPLLQGKTSLTVSEMQALPWVMEQGWPEQMSWLRGIGIDTDRLNVTTLPTEELALSAARQGYGLYVENEALMSEDIRVGNLRQLAVSDDDSLAYYIVTPSGPQRTAARKFIRWLKDSV
jgi:LysR family glycine cleavage system transcriptional activator